LQKQDMGYDQKEWSSDICGSFYHALFCQQGVMQRQVFMQEQYVISGNETHSGLTLQLTGSFLLVGGSGLLLSHWLRVSNLPPLFVVVLTLLGCVGIGLLTTANIQYGISLLRPALLRLAQGAPIEVPHLFWSWPLRSLFCLLASVGQKMHETVREEREYREQLLRQASEAAAIAERHRLAHELHDSIKQQLFSIRMSAIAAKSYALEGLTKAQDALEDIQRSAYEAQVEMQALLQHLRPVVLEHITLKEAISTQAQALEFRSGAQVAVEMAHLPTAERYSLPMQEATFRMVQEAFANIARHARAQHVRCTFTPHEEQLEVVIADDGQGFDRHIARTGMGLGNIQERVCALNGTLKIESEVGQGTTLRIQIPLLLSPEAKQLEEQRELEMQRISERVQGNLHLHSLLVPLNLILICTNLALLSLPVPFQFKELCAWLLIFCVSLMLYGLVSTHLATTRLTLLCGEKDKKVLAARYREHLNLASFVRLFLLVSGLLLFWVLNLFAAVLWWQRGLSFLLVAGFILALFFDGQRRLKQSQNRYYPLLSKISLSWEIRQREYRLRWRLILCFCLNIPLFLQGFLIFPHGSWLNDYLLFAFLTLLLSIVIEARRLSSWKRREMVPKWENSQVYLEGGKHG
jgi:signal transduction histidine kinase